MLTGIIEKRLRANVWNIPIRRWEERVENGCTSLVSTCKPGSPVEGVLIEEFSGGVNLNMAHAPVAGVPLKQPYLFFGEQNCLVLRLFFEPQQPLAPMREIVP